MADENVIRDNDGQQQDGPGKGAPGQPITSSPVDKLTDGDKKQLNDVVKRMQDAKESDDNIRAVVHKFIEMHGNAGQPVQPTIHPQTAAEVRSQPLQEKPPAESTAAPLQQIRNKVGADLDPAVVERQKAYDQLRTKAIKDVESPDWKDKIFTGKIPALTDDQNMPVEAFQKIDTKGLEEYLNTMPLNPNDKYWLRHQLINYGNQRQAQYYVDQRAAKNLEGIPQVKQAQDEVYKQVAEGKITPEQYEATWRSKIQAHPEIQQEVQNAYQKAANQYQAHQIEGVANRLNNVGLSDQPLSTNAPFHDQITGINKALMGAINYAGDLGQQVSSLLELSNAPAFGDLAYKLKTDADNLKAKNSIPQNGELGNVLAGEMVPMALDMEALRRLSGATGRPIYQSLARARATGALGQFAEGALGGIAVSPANSYILAHQYFNSLLQQGVDPASAASKSDQLLVKNMATDMVMLPLQMGLMKMPTGNWLSKALTTGAEAGVSGLHFTLQDFNQKSTENPAMHIADYISQDPDVAKTFVSGAVLGALQKAAVDRMLEADTKRETQGLFNYNKQYGAQGETGLPTNQTIANNMLAAFEMKDHPQRAQELKDMSDALKESGVYTTEEATRVNKIIDDVDAVRKQVPKYGTPQQKVAVMNELLNQRTITKDFLPEARNEAAAKELQRLVAASDERIGRIMSGKEPLYFVNGNETTKYGLEEFLEKNPAVLSAKGAKIEIVNDPETTENIKNSKRQYDAIQKQSPTTNDVRPTSGDSQAVGGRNEEQGAIDQNASQQGAPPAGGKQGPDNFLEARHADTIHDEEGRVSGQDIAGLSKQGIKDARLLGKEVAQHGITKIVGSDLPRNLETVAEVQKQLPEDVEHVVRTDLRSWDLGEFRGMKDDEFRQAQEFFVRNPDATQFEGKTLGESFNTYKDRIIDAMKDLQQEGPETLVINHSNNMNIWDAYKNNGMEWNEKTAEDYLNMKTPEPATLRSHPGEEEAIAEASKPGTDDNLLNTIKAAIDETTKPAEPIQPGSTAKAGGSETNGEPGQKTKEPGTEKGVPQPSKEATEGTPGTNAGAGAPNATGVTEKAALPGTKVAQAFVDTDVKPVVTQIADSFKNAIDLITKAFSPRSGVADKALTAITGAMGDRAKADAIVDASLRKFEKLFDKMKEPDRIAFIDRLKRGQDQGTPELNAIADMLRKMDKALYDEITKYKPSLPWKENHFRVLWKTIPGSQKSRIWSAFVRRPFQGSRGFMRKATLADMSEGIAMGGEPVSTNPISMFKLAYADGMKYVTAQRMFEALKKDGFVKFVRTGQEPPAGYVRLDDNLTKVYYRVPEGMVNMGEYHVDPGAARLLRNHLSRDYIREQPVGRGLMNLKNLFTQVELGLSVYHATAEGLESIGSQFGLGLRQLFNLGFARRDLTQVGKGVTNILTAPLAPYTSARLGKQFMNFTTSEEFRQSDFGKKFLQKYPAADQYVDDFFRGGGLMKAHEDYMGNSKKAFKENVAKNNYIGLVLRAAPAVNEALSSPLFNTFIPRMKVGMFMKEFPVALQENQARLNKGTISREALARRTISFVDDRLGEMNFDNLFWNRTFKTATQFFLRSVTWKLGNFRAMGGVIPEQAKEIYDAARERRAPMLMPKAAWLMGLTAMQVTLAKIIQGMAAGKDIEEPKDLVAPQVDPEDPDQRVILPTYYKDVLHLVHSPGGYVGGGLAGQIGRVADLWTNKDFYGYEIRDPTASYWEQAVESGKYLAPKPFSITSAQAMAEKGESSTKQIMSLLGLVKAPGYLTHTNIENKIFDLYNVRNTGTKPAGEREGNELKASIRQQYREGNVQQAEDLLNEGVQKGLLRPTQVRSLLQHAAGHTNPSEYFFKSLPFEDKEYLFKQMSDEEKTVYDPKGTLARQIETIETNKNE